MPMSQELTLQDDDPVEVLRNPAELGFPPMLPLELALKIDTPRAICEAYNITKEQFEVMIKHPLFIQAYQHHVEELKQDGMSFKKKAQIQAEEHLKTAWAMIQDPKTADSVRSELIRSTVRWAGYEPKSGGNAEHGGGFQININLG